MAISYGFYNSINGDRRYNAEQMTALFNGLINDGIFMSIGTSMMVTEATGMYVNIGVGRAWFNSTWTDNDAEILMAIDTSELAFDRIDIVCLEVNKSEASRVNTIKVIKGTPSLTPVAPTLIDTEFIHQYPLADIYVSAAVTEILTANITNRVGTAPCPFVTGILDTIDTTALVAQWGAEFDIWLTNIEDLRNDSSDAIDADRAGWELEFNTWFAEIQEILNESVAGNLLDLINANTEAIGAIQPKLDLIKRQLIIMKLGGI